MGREHEERLREENKRGKESGAEVHKVIIRGNDKRGNTKRIWSE